MKPTILRVALYFAAYSDNNLNSFAALSVSCLTGNPLTPNLPVTAPALGTLQVAFANSITAQQQGGRVETGKKDTARLALLAALRQNAAYVQSLGLTTVQDIFSTGYDVTSTNKTQSPLTTPVFALDNSFPGQITVDLSAVANAKSYQVQSSIGTGPWQEVGIFPNTRGIILTGLTQATLCNVRVRAIGGSTQYSQWGATVADAIGLRRENVPQNNSFSASDGENWHAELRLGYSRIWVSEHHNLNILQGSTPEVLLAAIGAQTARIRLGSGGVMLPNHSAYHIAENFRTLEALYPGRVDCGIGRASGGDSYSRSLLVPTPDAWGDFGDQADQLAGFFHDTCKRAFAMPSVTSAPPIWLLSAGSNADSGRLAAEKGMGLAVALFINPDASAEAVRYYKQNFRPSKEFPEPRVMIAVNAVVAATPEKLQENKKTSDWLRVMRDSGRYPTSVPAPEAIKNVHFGANEVDHLARIANRQIVGLPGEAKKQILERAKNYDADEVMLTMVTHKLSDKIEGFRLLAEAFGL